MFLFSIAGNTTYVLSILALSLSPKHILANAGWLAGMDYGRHNLIWR